MNLNVIASQLRSLYGQPKATARSGAAIRESIFRLDARAPQWAPYPVELRMSNEGQDEIALALPDALDEARRF